MARLPLIAQWVVRITGLIQIVLGLAIWTGAADGLIGVHILDGLLFVLALLTVAGLAARAGIDGWIVALAVVWAIVLPVFGLTQEGLLPGSGHVVVQVVHLLLGLGAIGLGERLAQRVRRAGLSVAPR